jgi:hypothetical protein
MESTFEVPAFPVPYENYHEGMTLRDYFAAAVLNGLFSRESTKTDREEKAVIASFAYDMADRMMEARSVEKYKTIAEALSAKNTDG